MTDNATMAEKIFELVWATGSVSFAELERIEGFKGDREMCVEDKNVVLWSGMSDTAIDALNELRSQGKIHAKGASLLVYMIDGMVLHLPLARSPRKYKKPHWAPTVFNAGPGRVNNPSTAS
jgi:hypothetical protein